MPPPRQTRRRSPRRLHSPDQTSSNTIDLSSSKLRKELPSQEPKRPADGLSKTRQNAHARSPVAETISKPSTSAASNKRRSGVVKEVEKMQVTVIILHIRFVLLPSLAPVNDHPFHLNIHRNCSSNPIPQVARDRRRAAAVVEQDARNRDPSNPNWEFQQMIDDFNLSTCSLFKTETLFPTIASRSAFARDL